MTLTLTLFQGHAMSGCWNWSFEPQDGFVSGPVQTLNDCESHEWLWIPWVIVSHMSDCQSHGPFHGFICFCQLFVVVVFFLFSFFLLLTFSFTVYIASVCSDQVFLVSGLEVSVYLQSRLKTILTVKVAEWEENRVQAVVYWLTRGRWDPEH